MLRSTLDQRSAQMLACLALVCIASSCERLTGPDVHRQQLAHVVTPPHIQLTNQTNKPVFYILLEESIIPLVNWAACADVSRCPSLAPKASMRVEFDRIAGYSAESKQAVLYWWHADGAKDGIQSVERIRSTYVQLH